MDTRLAVYTRWTLAVLAALLVISLLAYARGRVHHHGQYVGSRAAAVVGPVAHA